MVKHISGALNSFTFFSKLHTIDFKNTNSHKGYLQLTIFMFCEWLNDTIVTNKFLLTERYNGLFSV